jgi:hypothetical protein
MDGLSMEAVARGISELYKVPISFYSTYSKSLN